MFYIRYSDYSLLTEADIEDRGDHIRINFVRTKQDQFYSGTKSYLPLVGGKFCPVTLYRLYAQQFHFNFGPQGSRMKYLNFMVYNCNGIIKPKYHKSLSYGAAMNGMKEILAKYGIRKAYTENSFKAGGVTAYIESGNSLEATMIHGRWRGLQTPLYYLRGTDQYRLNLARNIPKISDAQFEI